jgi:hypothetical protein
VKLKAAGPSPVKLFPMPRFQDVRDGCCEMSRSVNVWWISFLNGSVLIIEASSIAHARTLAALRGIGRVSHFAGGHLISEEHAALIPPEFVGRMLSSDEARQMRNLFEASRRANEPAAPRAYER